MEIATEVSGSFEGVAFDLWFCCQFFFSFYHLKHSAFFPLIFENHKKESIFKDVNVAGY